MSQDFLGVSTWLRLAIEGNELSPFAEFLLDKAKENEDDHAAVMDLSIVAQLMGNSDWGVALQLETLSKQQVFFPNETQQANPRVKVLGVNVSGDLKQNTPLDCLFVDTENSLSHIYIGEGVPLSTKLPEHDVMFVSIAPTEVNKTAIKAVEKLINSGDSRVFINHPSRLLALLNKESTNDLLGNIPGVFTAVPETKQLSSSEQGLIPHYRVILVDGKPFVYQIALSDMLTDYISAEMQTNSEKQSLEARLIESFEHDLVEPFVAQWDEINHVIGLDYVSIDCAKTVDGELIVTAIEPSVFVHGFNLNSMHLPKLKAFETVRSAFHQMLYKKAFPNSKLFYRG